MSLLIGLRGVAASRVGVYARCPGPRR